MINISLKKNNISIKGHANYSEFGNDIVCAAVSTLATTTVNAILRFDSESISYKEKDGYLDIEIKKHTKETDVLINNMIDLLKDLREDYKKHIKINEEV